MTPEVLAQVSALPFQSDFTIGPEPGRYTGAAIPLDGIVAVTANRATIEAEIEDHDCWEDRMIHTLPQGAFLTAGGLFRTVMPNRLLRAEDRGEIRPSDGVWEALEATYIGQNGGLGSSSTATYRFGVTGLIVPGPAHGNEVAAVRHIYSRGDWNANATFQGHPLLIRSLSEETKSRDSETIAATFDRQPDPVAAEAVWLSLSFITGNTVKHLAEEFYDASGALIRRAHQLGSAAFDVRRTFFHRFYGPLASNGIEALADGFVRLMKANFPIEVILEHLHEAAGRSTDVEGQHLILAIHAGIEAWNRSFGKERYIEKSVWREFRKHAKELLETDALYLALPDEVRASVCSAFSLANHRTTGWRERAFFDALEIDVRNADDSRCLKYRNELLHSGFFVKRWQTLTIDEQQQRFLDIDRLRRLVLLIVFKLTGYRGTFMSPVTYQPETVEPVLLPAAIAPINAPKDDPQSR